MDAKIIPSDATIAELKKKVKECQEQAKTAPARRARELREKAALFREWIASLKHGKWTS
jgi:hypothetical protein